MDEAREVLDPFHNGSANIRGMKSSGNIVVEVLSVTGTNVTAVTGFPDQPTNEFFIKGLSSASVVPADPT